MDSQDSSFQGDKTGSVKELPHSKHERLTTTSTTIVIFVLTVTNFMSTCLSSRITLKNESVLTIIPLCCDVPHVQSPDSKD